MSHVLGTVAPGSLTGGSLLVSHGHSERPGVVAAPGPAATAGGGVPPGLPARDRAWGPSGIQSLQVQVSSH
jgi:hypothetical protein